MDRNRLINLGIVAGIVVVAILGWVIGVSPVLDQTSAAQAQTATLENNNATSQARLLLIKKQFAHLDVLKTQLASLQQSVPTSEQIPAFLAELNSTSAATGTVLTNLTVNDALAYVAPAAPGTAATTGDAAAEATSTPTPSPSDTAAAATTPTAPTAPAPSSGLVSIPVKVMVTGPYAGLMAFSGAIQTGSRLFMVTGFTVTSTDTGSYSAELDGSLYVLPAPAGTTPAASTPTKTPAPSTTPTPSSTVSAKPSGTPTSTPTPTGTAKP